MSREDAPRNYARFASAKLVTMSKQMFEPWNRAVLPYAFALALADYVMAALFGFIVRANPDAAFMMVLYCFYFGLTVVALIVGAVHGVRRGTFSVALVVLAAVLFIPVIMTMMNSSAWMFPVFYAAAFAVGNAGALIFKRR